MANVIPVEILEPFGAGLGGSATAKRALLDTVVDPMTSRTWRYVGLKIGGTTASTAEPGRPVYWDKYAQGTCLTDTGGTDKLFAGILVHRITCTASVYGYGWIQTEGPCWACVTASLAQGSQLIPNSAAGCLQIMGAANTDVICGVNLDAGAAVTLPLDAGGYQMAPSFTTAGGFGASPTVVAGGTLMDFATYALQFVDPMLTGDGTAVGTVTVTGGEGSDKLNVAAVTTAGSHYSTYAYLLVGTTRCFIRAPLL